jgi:hypothetical protein
MQEIKEKLFSKRIINEITGCWNYPNNNLENSGHIRIDNKLYLVSRISAALFLNFDITSKLFVLHKCDNPACFNPDHLFIGTDVDNAWDKVYKGRAKGRFSNVTHCINDHEFTKNNTYWSINDNSFIRRQCKKCLEYRRSLRKKKSV